MYHPFSLDIIEYKVVGILQYEDFTHYRLKAVRNVGACGKIEVVIDSRKGEFRFVELIDEDEIEYSSGLQNFIEGKYYPSLNRAKLEFYEIQRVLHASSVDQKERVYKEAKANYEKVLLLIEKAKEGLKSE